VHLVPSVPRKALFKLLQAARPSSGAESRKPSLQPFETWSDARRLVAGAVIDVRELFR